MVCNPMPLQSFWGFSDVWRWLKARKDIVLEEAMKWILKFSFLLRTGFPHIVSWLWPNRPTRKWSCNSSKDGKCNAFHEALNNTFWEMQRTWKMLMYSRIYLSIDRRRMKLIFEPTSLKSKRKEKDGEKCKRVFKREQGTPVTTVWRLF